MHISTGMHGLGDFKPAARDWRNPCPASPSGVVMLHRLLFPWLKAQLAHAQALWVQDRASGRNGVFMPHAQERKYLRAGESWAWFWVFPSPKLSIDPQTEVERRHHLFEERLNRQLKKAVALAGTDI